MTAVFDICCTQQHRGFPHIPKGETMKATLAVFLTTCLLVADVDAQKTTPAPKKPERAGNTTIPLEYQGSWQVMAYRGADGSMLYEQDRPNPQIRYFTKVMAKTKHSRLQFTKVPVLSKASEPSKYSELPNKKPILRQVIQLDKGCVFNFGQIDTYFYLWYVEKVPQTQKNLYCVHIYWVEPSYYYTDKEQQQSNVIQSIHKTKERLLPENAYYGSIVVDIISQLF